MDRGNGLDHRSGGNVGWIAKVGKERKAKMEEEVESHKNRYKTMCERH